MPLKQLVLNGFKSFADKTTINFDSGITGIVGPNGSGKSNITEAIRWVMGEGSAKSLRGENMKDVIFAGSQFRPALNRAEVSLIFDNQNRQMNVDSDQVSITRRILRSGDSDYLINNQSVRLKDIRELFINIGLSSDSLAIISQGKVDQILNSRPEDRRGIFEEAAGVLHFKQQKEVALRQLDKTNENLIRINDLVKELEDRVEPLHEQSSLAKQYKFEKGQLDSKLKQLLALQIQDLDENKKQIEEKASENKSILEKLDREVKSSQKQLASKKAESTELHEKKDNQQKSLLSLTQRIASLNTDLQMSQQSSEYDAATKKEYSNQKQELEAHASEVEATLKELLDRIDKQKIELDGLIAKKKDIEGDLKQDPASLNQELENIRMKYIDLLQEQTSTNNQIVYLQNEIERSKHTNDSDLEVKKELLASQEKLDELKKKGQVLVEDRRKLEVEIASLKDKLALEEKRKNDLTQLINQTEASINRQKAQLDGLKRLQDRHEGYYYGVKYVLNHQNDFPGVVGVIGELINFPTELEAALTTALGGGVQNLVTLNRERARDAIAQLKRSRAGRATFLPLDSLRQHAVAQSTLNTLTAIDGFIGVASELVSSQSKTDISPAINYLLGNVLVARDMNTALRIQTRTGHFYRIVTLDGDIISPGGSMSGGARNQKNNSPLQVNAEMENLRQSISQQQAALDKYSAQLDSLQNDAESLHYAQLQDKLRELKQQISEQAIRYQNQEKEVARLNKLNEVEAESKRQKENQLNELKSRLETEKLKKQELAKQADDYRKKMDQLKLAMEDLDKAYEELQQRLSAISSSIAVAKNKKENLLHQERQSKDQLNGIKAQIKELNQKIEHLEHTKGKASEEQIKGQISSLSAQKDKMNQELADSNQRLGKLDAQITHLEAVSSRNYDLRKNATEEQETLSVKLSQLSERINRKLHQLSQDYSLTYQAALALTDGKNSEEKRASLEKEVKLHKMSIADIGPVNLNAIEEYDDVKTRYDFLNGQQNDLLKARSDIEESMSKLDQEVKSRFKDTFNKVQERFAKIFPTMFGGGNAKLVLTEPDKLLETGIEIIAQPPGKKLQKLSLLSGGERALTAITLLFAMLEVNPVPFCILDEVEAALDDANVDRFAKFLNHYDTNTQFIVITHRRGTMRKSDNLYGVVMQESGVSQVLSVSLKEMKEEVE